MENSRTLECGFRLWVAVVITLAFTTNCHSESIYTVGLGSDATWGVPPHPSAFQDWADGLQFCVKDSLYFTFDNSSHNVKVVQTIEELQNCSVANSLLAEDFSGDSVFTFASPGPFYVMSAGGRETMSDCNSGMKFRLYVYSPTGPFDFDHNSSCCSDRMASGRQSPESARYAAPSSLLLSNTKVEIVSKASVAHRNTTTIPWMPRTDPNWASSIIPKGLEVDSYFVFQYSSTDNFSVYRVDEEHFKECDSSNAFEEVEFAATVSLPQPGVYYYIDGNQSLCQNAYMKVLLNVPDADDGSHLNVKVVVPAVVVTLSVVLALIVWFFIHRYRKQTAHTRYTDHFIVYSRSYERAYEPKAMLKARNSRNKILMDSLSREQHENKLCKLVLSLKELELATGNFSMRNELGSGAFGTVYKGILRDGRTVAVKRANTHRAPDVDQFVNEVSVLSQVNHRHLVKLLGCCLDVRVPLLVYEFVPNGTLQEQLSLAEQGYNTKLDWPHRFAIAMQTAEALKYLHSEAMPPIVHRDVKAANILLDEDFGAKVADFGLSKLVDVGVTHVSTAIRGTPGYLDPEYFFNSQLTDKSDVYSFGIVLLELITSKKPIDLSLDPNEQNLALRLVPMIKNKRTKDIIDPLLMQGLSKKDLLVVESVAEVAVACLVPQRASRPTMSEVLEMLRIIKGSDLQADSFFSKDDIINEGSEIDHNPFLVPGGLQSFNWSEVSSQSAVTRSLGRRNCLPGGSCSSNQPFATSPLGAGDYFDRDYVLPR